jgi:hypothetical protein
LTFLVVATLNIRTLPRLYDTQNMKGVGLLLWAPFCYCAGLLFLANWLIMRNAFFPLQSLAPALSPHRLRNLSTVLPGALLGMPWICVGGLVMALCSVVGRKRVAAEGLGAGLIALFLLKGLFSGTPVYVPGTELFSLIFGVSAILFPGLFLFELFDARWQRNAAILITVATLFAGIAFPRPMNLPGKDLLGIPPSIDEIKSVIDFYWDDARIAVFGPRASAFYFDKTEKRFIARIDFHPRDLVSKAATEQLYLLVPPDDGRFYGKGTPIQSIHSNGAEWLLVERVWESGWQLWRCIVYDPPPSQ